MNKLEHKIQEAFEVSDGNTRMPGKDAMWSRLDRTMHKPTGVAALWRVAAVFFAMLMFAGVWAGVSVRKKHLAEMEMLRIENVALIATIDSLKAVPPIIEKELTVVEKEKIVYRAQSSPKTMQELVAWKNKFNQLKDSVDVVLAQQNTTHTKQIQRLEKDLEAIRKQLSEENAEVENAPKTPFQLKGERIEMDVQKKPKVESPEVEIRVFQREFMQRQNNLNKTLFNK